MKKKILINCGIREIDFYVEDDDLKKGESLCGLDGYNLFGNKLYDQLEVTKKFARNYGVECDMENILISEFDDKEPDKEKLFPYLIMSMDLKRDKQGNILGLTVKKLSKAKLKKYSEIFKDVFKDSNGF